MGAGPGNTGLWALRVDGWVAMICKRREGPLEDAGMWASSPHTTQSGSARSGWGPTCECLLACPRSLPAVVPSRGDLKVSSHGGLLINGNGIHV